MKCPSNNCSGKLKKEKDPVNGDITYRCNSCGYTKVNKAEKYIKLNTRLYK